MKQKKDEIWFDGGYGYESTPRGLFYLKKVTGKDDTTFTKKFPMTNFGARIIEEIVKDDGTEARNSFVIEAHSGKRTRRVEVVASEFEKMAWPIQKLGPSAVVYPNMGNHARTAIQLFSEPVPERRVYAHLGWIPKDGKYLYLHADGAIGPLGPVPGVEVRPPGDLSRFRLPPPPRGQELVRAIHKSIHFLKVAPEAVTLPLFALIYRAPLGEMDTGLELVGPTGAFKSELAARVQQHYGREMNRLYLPCAWTSTANSLEAITHAAKDVVLVIDDHAPDGTALDAARAEADAARLFRAQGNRSGRQRMRSDGSLVPARAPRGTILSTAENEYGRHSVQARKLVIQVKPGDVSVEQLTICQRHGDEGYYAAAMAGYIKWLSVLYPKLRTVMSTEFQVLRDDAAQAGTEGTHRRVPEIAANFALGLIYFLRFAKTGGAITQKEANTLRDRWLEILVRATVTQAEGHKLIEPHRRFIELLRAALVSGRAHLADFDGSAPSSPAACGWRLTVVGMRDGEETTDWRSQGERVGWINDNGIYLEPETTYAIIQKLARDQNTTFSISENTLRKRLHEHGLLATVEARANQTHLTIRQMIGNVRQYVLHLRLDTLFPTSEVAQQAQTSGSTGEQSRGPVGPLGPVPGRKTCTTDTDSKGIAAKEPSV